MLYLLAGGPFGKIHNDPGNVDIRVNLTIMLLFIIVTAGLSVLHITVNKSWRNALVMRNLFYLLTCFECLLFGNIIIGITAVVFILPITAVFIVALALSVKK